MKSKSRSITTEDALRMMQKLATGGGTVVSPTITVTDIDGGHRISITDVNGTQSIDVMDGDDASVIAITNEEINEICK